MKYLEVTFYTHPCDETINDILAALCGKIGFESFMEAENGIKGYVQEVLYNEDALKNILETFPIKDTEISYQVIPQEDKDWNEEWETLIPKVTPFPQTSHLAMRLHLLLFVMESQAIS